MFVTYKFNFLFNESIMEKMKIEEILIREESGLTENNPSILHPTKHKIRAKPFFKCTNCTKAPANKKYKDRKPRIANTLEV